MAGLPWIELHVGLPRHPKAIRLGRLVGDERAWAYMAQVWLWCAEECPGGVVAGEDAGLILEHAAGWRGEPGKLATAAVAVGFLDQVDGGLEVHGWGERAAAHLAKRARDAERQRKRYERITKKFRGEDEDSRGEPAENPRRTNGRRADLSGNSNTNPDPNPLPSEEFLPPAGAAGSGTPLAPTAGTESAADRTGPSGAAGELPLGIEVAPGAAVAKAVKARGKKANASGEASMGPQGGFRRQLTDALDAAFLRATRTRYNWDNKRNYSSQGLGSSEKPGAVYRLAERYGIPEVAGRFELGARESLVPLSNGKRKAANIWELPDAWAHLTDAVPADPAAPQEPAWMAGEVGERWRQAREDSGKAHTFGEVVKLLVAVEQDVDVLRLVAADKFGADWIRGNCLDMLQEWLGPATIEVQPGGGE